MLMDFRTWVTVIAFVVVVGGLALYVSIKIRESMWWLFLSESQRRDFVFAVVIIPTAILLAILLLAGGQG